MDRYNVLSGFQRSLEQWKFRNQPITLEEYEKLVRTLHTSIFLTEGAADYDDAMKDRIHEFALEHYKITTQYDLAANQHKQGNRNESFKATVQLAISLLKTIMLLNGAAAVAILSFIGNYKSKLNIEYITNALLIYVVGVLLSAIAYGLSYLAQYHYTYSPVSVGDTYRRIVIIVVIGSMLYFMSGSICFYLAFVKT